VRLVYFVIVHELLYFAVHKGEYGWGVGALPGFLWDLRVVDYFIVYLAFIKENIRVCYFI